MPKPNKALFLFALLSISAFYNLKQGGSTQTEQKIKQALIRLESKLKHYQDENVSDVLLSEIIEDILVVSKEDILQKLDEVKTKLANEKESHAVMVNMIHLKEKTRGSKVARQLRELHQLKIEQSSQVIYELSSEMKELTRDLSSFRETLSVAV